MLLKTHKTYTTLPSYDRNVWDIQCLQTLSLFAAVLRSFPSQPRIVFRIAYCWQALARALVVYTKCLSNVLGCQSSANNDWHWQRAVATLKPTSIKNVHGVYELTKHVIYSWNRDKPEPEMLSQWVLLSLECLLIWARYPSTSYRILSRDCQRQQTVCIDNENSKKISKRDMLMLSHTDCLRRKVWSQWVGKYRKAAEKNSREHHKTADRYK